MSKSKVELVAAYFTLSGDVYPFGPTEISPFSFKDRVEAAAKAGWDGIGLIHSDIYATADKIGFAEMRRILAGFGMTEECKWGKPTYTVDGKNIVII